jgi:glucose-1-phosphate adenylyltransferase
MESSIVGDGCRIAGVVRDSILSPGVVVEQGATVERSILMHDVWIGPGARVSEAILDKGASVGEAAVVGGVGAMVPNRRYPTHVDGGHVLIGKRARVPAGATVERNAILFPFVTVPRGDQAHVLAGETIGDMDH